MHSVDCTAEMLKDYTHGMLNVRNLTVHPLTKSSCQWHCQCCTLQLPYTRKNEWKVDVFRCPAGTRTRTAWPVIDSETTRADVLCPIPNISNNVLDPPDEWEGFPLVSLKASLQVPQGKISAKTEFDWAINHQLEDAVAWPDKTPDTKTSISWDNKFTVKLDMSMPGGFQDW